MPPRDTHDPDWPRLFPEADYRLSMGLHPGDTAGFWTDWDSTGLTTVERQIWLQATPELYTAARPESHEATAEAHAWMQHFSSAPEPDWVLLSGEADSEPRVIAGEVVFPSAWSLPEKLNLPMSAVHAPVPGLENQLGSGIHTFLTRLEPGAPWQRENWGLAANAELNHHPTRALPRLTSSARPETTWIRLEHQFLTRLTVSRSILFGIRITCHRLDEVAAMPGMSARIHRALSTMPEPIARYKGLLESRLSLTTHL